MSPPWNRIDAELEDTMELQRMYRGSYQKIRCKVCGKTRRPGNPIRNGVHINCTSPQVRTP
jgi:hypothetical protein